MMSRTCCCYKKIEFLLVNQASTWQHEVISIKTNNGPVCLNAKKTRVSVRVHPKSCELSVLPSISLAKIPSQLVPNEGRLWLRGMTFASRKVRKLFLMALQNPCRDQNKIFQRMKNQIWAAGLLVSFSRQDAHMQAAWCKRRKRRVESDPSPNGYRCNSPSWLKRHNFGVDRAIVNVKVTNLVWLFPKTLTQSFSWSCDSCIPNVQTYPGTGQKT